MAARSSSLSLLAGAAALLAVACGREDGPAAAAGPSLADDLAAGTPRRVLVVLAAPEEAEPASAEKGADARKQLLAARVAGLAVAKERLVRAFAADELAVVSEYRALPAVHVELRSLAALERLRARGDVAGIHEDVAHEAFLAQSLPLVGQPAAAAAGAVGEGTSVAVLDTGVDYRRPELGGCTSPGAPSSCRVAYAADFAPDDGALDAHGHGTNVAAIVAGVAPGAKILALDVFNGGYAYSSDILSAIDWCIQHRDEYRIAAMNLSLGSGGSTTPCANDVFASAIRSARQAGILAAIATGNSAYADRVASPACAPDAVSVGAVYDAPMGGVGWSGCNDATTAADRVACFSNSASFVTLLAPGAMITAGGTTMSGTSQAAPHVAGAIAVARGMFPEDSPDDTVARLRATGKPIVDARNSVTTPRIDLGAVTGGGGCSLLASPTSLSAAPAGGSLAITVTTGGGCSWTATSDAGWATVQPASGTGSATLSVVVAPNAGASRGATITIGGRAISLAQAADAAAPTGSLGFGGLTVTRTLAVTLSIAATDPSGVATMCVANGTSCTAWGPYAATRAWTLASGSSGVRTVRAWLRDARGNTSATPITASIVYDVAPPSGGSIAATGSAQHIALSWGGFRDALSGVARYVLVAAQGTAAPASCAAGTLLADGPATSFVHAGLVDGTPWSYRVCAVDGAGNTSTGAIATARPAPEFVPPTGTLKVNGGATVTTSLAATLALTASDASGVASMCVSNGTSCAAWEPFAAARAWSLAGGGSGTRTVRVWLRDVYGNVTSSPLAATIVYDVTAPSAGSLTATGSAGQVALSWKGATDAHSGIARHVLVAAQGTTPASCAVGLKLFEGMGTSFVHTGLVNGTEYGYRVCAVDAAGNVSAGAAAAARPAPEYAAPTGTLQVNDGAAVTTGLAVSLALTGVDASGVASMCLSNATSCAAWEPFAATKSWTLASGGTGTRTVRAWLRDAYGNATATPLAATIAYDVSGPAGGSLTATAGSRQIALAWKGFSDAQSGVASYVLVGAAGKTAPTCAAGARLYEGTATAFVHEGLAGGAAWAYRVCAVDGVGNVSAGATRTAAALP